MQYLMVYASNSQFLHDDQWQFNGAGLKVSHWYGFGIIDGAALVNRARNWNTVPPRSICTINMTSQFKGNEIATNISPLALSIQTTNCNLVYLEHVQAVTSLRIQEGMRKDVSIYLTSPAQTKSILLPFRSRDRHKDGFHLWPFMTVQSWGEKPQGNWIFSVKVKHGSTVILEALKLILYGTLSIPLSVGGIPTHCHPQCLRGCARKGPQYCDVCRKYQIAQTLECVEYCPPGTYLNKDMCRDCPPLCAQCNDAYSCTQCQSHAFQLPNGSCSKQCSMDTFPSNKSCIPCHQSCLSCGGPHETNCTSCLPQFALKDNACMIREPTSCPNGQYFDHRAHECRLCHTSCSSCNGKESTQCTSCLKGTSVSLDGRCIDSRHLRRTCHPGQYLDGVNFECVACPLSCSNCSDNLTCTSCPVDQYLTQHGTCVETCVSQTANEIISFCRGTHCHHSCLTCFGPESIHCNSCPQGFLFFKNSCIENCPLHYYRSNLTCRTCHSSCKSCVGPSENHCLSCPPGEFLNDQKCVKNCPAGNYGSKQGLCSPCMNDCLGCSSLDSCIRCRNGYYLLDVTVTKCVAHCPSGYILHPPSQSCQPCPSNCATCNTTVSCYSCHSGYVYYAPSGSCQAACPDGYYSSPSRHCISCHPPCSTCTGSALNCSTCSIGMAMDTVASMCRKCCNPDKANTQCCDCSRDSKICFWVNVSHDSFVTQSPIGSHFTAHKVIGITITSLVLLLCLSLLAVLSRHYCSRFNKQYHKVPSQETLEIADDSGSDADLYTTDVIS